MARKNKSDTLKTKTISPFEPKPIKSELERLIDQKEEMLTKLRSGVNISSKNILAIKNKIAELENKQ